MKPEKSGRVDTASKASTSAGVRGYRDAEGNTEPPAEEQQRLMTLEADRAARTARAAEPRIVRLANGSVVAETTDEHNSELHVTVGTDGKKSFRCVQKGEHQHAHAPFGGEEK